MNNFDHLVARSPKGVDNCTVHKSPRVFFLNKCVYTHTNHIPVFQNLNFQYEYTVGLINKQTVTIKTSCVIITDYHFNS